MFSVRIVTTDHYQSDPIPGLDTGFSEFRGEDVKKVPVFRIFGSTPAGQKTCMHVHGVFPYLYVPYDGTQPWERYLRQFASSLDKAINVAMGTQNSKTQHVYKISIVSGIPMYGYHPEEQQFLKIYLYNPNMVRKAADLLLGGAVMNKMLQPHESHIPYNLQFFMDYNLYGMNLINLAAVKFRQSEAEKLRKIETGIGKQDSEENLECSNTSEMKISQLSRSIMDYSGVNATNYDVWKQENLSSDMFIDTKKSSTCELEVDVVAADIINRLEVNDNVGTNPGLAALWEDERQRRRVNLQSSQLAPQDSQERDDDDCIDTDLQMRARLKEIVLEMKPFLESQSDDNSVMSVEDDDLTPDIPSLPASQVDFHFSQDEESINSQSTVVFDDDTEDAKPVININSIKKVISMSQSFAATQTGDTEDKSLADILASLADEQSPPSSQETASQIAILEEHDSILQSNTTILDEKAIEQDDIDTAEMSQQVWETPPDEAQENCSQKESDMAYNLEGLEATWNESQSMVKEHPPMHEDYSSDDDIPQLDGPVDKKPDSSQKRKRLGTRGPVSNYSPAVDSYKQYNVHGSSHIPGGRSLSYPPPSIDPWHSNPQTFARTNPPIGSPIHCSPVTSPVQSSPIRNVWKDNSHCNDTLPFQSSMSTAGNEYHHKNYRHAYSDSGNHLYNKEYSGMEYLPQNQSNQSYTQLQTHIRSSHINRRFSDTPDCSSSSFNLPKFSPPYRQQDISSINKLEKKAFLGKYDSNALHPTKSDALPTSSNYATSTASSSDYHSDNMVYSSQHQNESYECMEEGETEPKVYEELGVVSSDKRHSSSQSLVSGIKSTSFEDKLSPLNHSHYDLFDTSFSSPVNAISPTTLMKSKKQSQPSSESFSRLSLAGIESLIQRVDPSELEINVSNDNLSLEDNTMSENDYTEENDHYHNEFSKYSSTHSHLSPVYNPASNFCSNFRQPSTEQLIETAENLRRLKSTGMSVDTWVPQCLVSDIQNHTSPYTFIFRVPTPVYKRFKYMKYDLYQHIGYPNIVRMHPQDARRYSLLKIGKEIVEVKRLSIHDIKQIRSELKFLSVVSKKYKSENKNHKYSKLSTSEKRHLQKHRWDDSLIYKKFYKTARSHSRVHEINSNGKQIDYYSSSQKSPVSEMERMDSMCAYNLNGFNERNLHPDNYSSSSSSAFKFTSNVHKQRRLSLKKKKRKHFYCDVSTDSSDSFIDSDGDYNYKRRNKDHRTVSRYREKRTSVSYEPNSFSHLFDECDEREYISKPRQKKPKQIAGVHYIVVGRFKGYKSMKVKLERLKLNSSTVNVNEFLAEQNKQHKHFKSCTNNFHNQYKEFVGKSSDDIPGDDLHTPDEEPHGCETESFSEKVVNNYDSASNDSEVIVRRNTTDTTASDSEDGLIKTSSDEDYFAGKPSSNSEQSHKDKQKKKKTLTPNQRLGVAFLSKKPRKKRIGSDKLLNSLSVLHQATLANLHETTTYTDDTDDYKSSYDHALQDMALFSPPDSEKGDSSPPVAMSPSQAIEESSENKKLDSYDMDVNEKELCSQDENKDMSVILETPLSSIGTESCQGNSSPAHISVGSVNSEADSDMETLLPEHCSVKEEDSCVETIESPCGNFQTIDDNNSKTQTDYTCKRNSSGKPINVNFSEDVNSSPLHSPSDRYEQEEMELANLKYDSSTLLDRAQSRSSSCSFTVVHNDTYSDISDDEIPLDTSKTSEHDDHETAESNNISDSTIKSVESDKCSNQQQSVESSSSLQTAVDSRTSEHDDHETAESNNISDSTIKSVESDKCSNQQQSVESSSCFGISAGETNSEYLSPIHGNDADCGENTVDSVENIPNPDEMKNASICAATKKRTSKKAKTTNSGNENPSNSHGKSKREEGKSGTDGDKIDTSETIDPLERKNEDKVQMSTEKLVIQPVHPPPTRVDVNSTALDYGLSVLKPMEAFCSDPADLPDKPRDFGGRMLKLQSNLLKDLKEFETTVDGGNLKFWRAKYIDENKIFSSQEQVTSLLNKINNEPEYKFALIGDQNTVISPCLLPPKQKDITEWAKGRMFYKKLKRDVKNSKLTNKSNKQIKAADDEKIQEDSSVPFTREKCKQKRRHLSDSGVCTDTKVEDEAILQFKDTPEDSVSLTVTKPTPVKTRRKSLDDNNSIIHSTPVKRGCMSELLPPTCTPISNEKQEIRSSDDKFLTPRPGLNRQASSNTENMLQKTVLLSQLKHQYSTPLVKKGSTSQIDRPTPNNTYGFKVNEDKFQDAKALHEFQYLTTLSMELHIDSRGDLAPDPEFDAIQAVFFNILNDIPAEKGERNVIGAIIVDKDSSPPDNLHQSDNKNISTSQNPSSSSSKAARSRSPKPSTSKKIHCQSSSPQPSTSSSSTNITNHIVGNTLLEKSGVAGMEVQYVRNEEKLIEAVCDLISKWDPDILVGYEIQMLSWGYLLQRASQINFKITNKISRTPDSKYSSHMSSEQDEWGSEHSSEIHIGGRIVLNLWRILKHETALNIYTFENVAFHVLHKRIPLFSNRTLNSWFNHKLHVHRWRMVEHYITRVKGNLELIDQFDLIGRTSEFARVFGIEFYHVLSRGSQYRVESMMLRIAKPMNYIPVSPNVHQRARMRTAECIPLTLEPESNFYTHPVVVVDFQSLYPSIMIAYNYCFTTCIGRLQFLEKAHEGPVEFGCTSLNISPSTLKKIQNDVSISPNGVGFLKPHVRKGVLPRMVEEILNTRLMVKKAMKDYKNDKGLHRLLNARQLGLKLIANVTYGYTGASFSGRMPSIEVGDSIVRKARETLERSIKLVEDTPKWRARVIYGDTDSMFILLKGRTKEEAFKIGQEIADTVTHLNPKPVKLKFEKVYMPCVLQTKKRYAGFSYETPDQKEPIFDAKGIETVRRDSCPAVSKILEKCLKILFTVKDVSQVKSYVLRQFQKIMEGKVGLQDYIFAKEFRGMKGYKPGACVPALEIARKLVRQDKRAEPRSGSRIPYIIVYGSPGLPLIQLIRQPSELLKDPSLRLNSTYYISKQILPPLDRVFSLIGVDVFSWFSEMPKTIKVSTQITSGTSKGTISQYFSIMNCPICDKESHQPICKKCTDNPALVSVVLNKRIRDYEQISEDISQICYSCMGLRDINMSCVSFDCPILFRAAIAKKDIQQASYYREILEKSINF